MGNRYYGLGEDRTNDILKQNGHQIEIQRHLGP